MCTDANLTSLKQGYEALLQAVQSLSAAEDSIQQALSLDANQRQELQSLWNAGQLGRKATSLKHGSVHIRDFGQWNRGEGAEFLRIEMELEGKWHIGHAVFTLHSDEWEKRGCHQNAHYADTVLHICLNHAGPNTSSLTCQQREVPIICIPEQAWREALGLPMPLQREALRLCTQPLDETPKAQIISLLKAAAAYRMAQKRSRFAARAEMLGRSQAWYEAWAESLGYYSNRHQMKLLARRVPLTRLDKNNAEALLFGTAGFLIPVLPSTADNDDRSYHRITWDIWWPQREQFDLSDSRRPHSQLAGQRPMNHPNRRVAALAATVQRWEEFEHLLHASKLAELESFRQSLSHPYWNYHSALPSHRSPRRVALVGKERLRAFLINHLLVNDESALAWQIYSKEKERSVPSKILNLAQQLFGDRSDLNELLPYCYAQQGILQIGLDFSLQNNARKRAAKLPFPQELAEWRP